MPHNLTTDPDAFFACRFATLLTSPLVEAPFGVFNFEFCISNRTLALDSWVLIPTDDKLLTIRLWEEITVAGHGASGTYILCCVSRVDHWPRHLRKGFITGLAAVPDSIEAILHYRSKASPTVAIFAVLGSTFSFATLTEVVVACISLLKTITVTLRAWPDVIDEVFWELIWAVCRVSNHHINVWSCVPTAHLRCQFVELIIFDTLVSILPGRSLVNDFHPDRNSYSYEPVWYDANDAAPNQLFTPHLAIRFEFYLYKSSIALNSTLKFQ